MTTDRAGKIESVVHGIEVILGAAPYVGPMITQILETIKRKEEYTDEEWAAVTAKVEQYKASEAWQTDSEQ